MHFQPTRVFTRGFITLLLIIVCAAELLAGYLQANLVFSLNWMAWTFTGYMLIQVVVTVVNIPPTNIVFRIPKAAALPSGQIDRHNAPVIHSMDLPFGEQVIASLIGVLGRKLCYGADESAIHSLMTARMQNIRAKVHHRYSASLGSLNVLAFEGVMGTILGMMVFLAQSNELFKLPTDTKDVSAFADALIVNMGNINLITVLTAFITSLIGWGAKGWLGSRIEAARDAQLKQLLDVEEELQTKFLSRLHLPSEVTALHRIADMPELAKFASMAAEQKEWMEQATSAAGELRTLLEMVLGIARDAQDMVVEVRHVEGGLRIQPKRHGEVQS